jgi:hypothetical protein
MIYALYVAGKLPLGKRKVATPGVERSKYGGEGLRFDISNLGLDSAVQRELEEAAKHSVARKTWATYGTAERLLGRFYKEKKKMLVLPMGEGDLLNFIHWLAYERGVSAATISGVKKLHIIRGFAEPQLRSQLVKMVLEGRKNMEAADRLRRRNEGRQPVTVDILRVIKNRLVEWQASNADKVSMWAVCTLLFNGVLRGGEVLSRSVFSFDPACTLLRKDVAVVEDCKEKGKCMVQIRVKMPKEDRRGEVTVVDVYQGDADVCPVRAVRKWLRVSAGAEDEQPAFRFDSGMPITSASFNRIIRERLQGVLKERITTHSFRTGAASRMGQFGMSDKDVKAAGRWGSRAFETYLRLPRTNRMVVARKISNLA